MQPGPDILAPDILAIDLGKTTCRAALWRDGTALRAQGPGAPGLASPDGAAAAEAAILAVLRPLRPGPGVVVSIGAAGAATAPEAAEALARLLCRSLGVAEVLVASDAVTAHAGALGGEPGVVLVAGTGAVATALGPDGVFHRTDGLGPWLGDEGGGAAIGLAGLRAAFRAEEGRGEATVLLAAARSRFNSLPELVAVLNGSDNAPGLAAAFAPDVAAASCAGDPVAAAIMNEATAALGRTVSAAAARLPPGRWPLATLGGLVELGLRCPDHPSLAPVPPSGTALDGARLIATGAAPLHAALAVRARAGAGGHVLDSLATEAVRPGLDSLDRAAPGAVVRLAVEGELAAAPALKRALPALSEAGEAIAARMRTGGRLFTLGAGTPGRLAVLDAAELGPTFSAPPDLVIPLLAGGPGAMIHAVEGAEDDENAAARALDAHGLTAADAVVGIAASGRTPFVLGGLRHARARGAATVGIVNNPGSPIAAAADIAVEILTGPELIGGSTRMVAGTTQKIALNAVSTAAMVALGKTYGARMVDVRASNEKLRRRALRTVREVAGVGEAEAAAALEQAGGQLKPALVMLVAGLPAAEAAARLERNGGRVRDALEEGS